MIDAHDGKMADNILSLIKVITFPLNCVMLIFVMLAFTLHVKTVSRSS